MSVIDSLVIELNLDASKMSKGAKRSIKDLRAMEKQAEKTGKDVAESGDHAAEFFSKVRREALGMFAVFTAGRSIKAFVGDITRSNAQLGYLSSRLGIAPQKLYQMEQAAKAAGGSVGEVGQALDALQQRITDPQQAAAVGRIFQQLGLSADQWWDAKTGGISDHIVEKLNQSIHANHLASPLAAALMRDLGLGDGVINQALMDPARLARIQQQFAGLGPTPEQIKASQQLAADWQALTQQGEKFGRTVLGDVTPALDTLVLDTTSLLKNLNEWSEKNPLIVKELAEVALGVAALGTVIGTVAGGAAFLRLLALPGAIRAAREAAAGIDAGGEAVPGAPKVSAEAASGGASALRMAGRALRVVGGALGLYGDAQIAGAIWNETRDSTADLKETIDARDHRVDREKQAVAFFMKSGFSRNAALGIVGNLLQESGLNGRLRGDGGHAFGIAQWHRDRVEDIRKRFGIDVTKASYEDQLRAVLLEMQSGGDAGARRAYRALHNNPSATLYDSTSNFRANFEAPGNKLGNEDLLRFSLAQRAAKDVGGGNTVSVGDIHIHTPATDPQQHGEIVQSVLRRRLPLQNVNGMQ